MADFGNYDFLGHQKKRNFVYKPAINLPTERNSLSRHTGNGGPRIFPDRVSPHKRLKTSHDRFGKIADEIVAEEECRDLLPDAFDEELDGIEDDFDDDILTVEQIDECDRIVSHELQNAPFEDIELKQTQEYISNTSPLQPLSSTVKEPDQVLRSDTWSAYSNQEDALCTNTFAPSAAGFPSASARDRNLKTHTPFVTIPEENFHTKPPTSSKSYSVVVSSVAIGHCTNSFYAANNVTGDILGSSCSPSIRNKDPSFSKPFENDRVQTLRKELDKLKSENAAAKSRVKTLEEEKFSKDGEIKILRDSLERFHAEEKRKQEEAKATHEKFAREQSNRERDLERQVENLTTRIQFKDREILQVIEQSKKITSLVEGSPRKKSLSLSETFPAGSSFFQKTSPEASVKSPRDTKSTTELNFQIKTRSQRLSQREHPEAIASSGGSTASLLQQIQAQKRDTETVERNLCQCRIQFLPEVELVQKLLTNKANGLPVVNWEHENSDFYENSIVPLLKPDPCFIDSDLFIQRTAFSHTDIPHTLSLFETQASSRLPRCLKSIASSGSSHVGYDNQMVIQTLYELLNKSHADCSLEGKNDSMLFLNPQPQDHLCSATNFLPLLELHISQYVEQRIETSEENVMSTCLPRSSSPGESPEPNDVSGGDSEHAEKLALLQQSAVSSLKLLNILVLYSHEVQVCILKSARFVNGGNANENKDAQRRETDDEISKAFPFEDESGTYSQHFLFPGLKNVVKKYSIPSSDNPVAGLDQLTKDDGVERTSPSSENQFIHEVTQRTELLSYLFKLLAPEPKESAVVVYTTLQVLDSLARNCEGPYYTRLYPLLDDGLLSQCLSRDWCLTSLLLVTSLLTPLTRHGEIVRKLCSQSDECILLKIYQGWIYRPENVPSAHCQTVHLKIVAMVNNLLSNGHSSDLLFPVESECQCNIELIKCLVLMLSKELSFLCPLSVERLVENTDNSYSLMLVRQGVFLLTILCLNDRLFVEHRFEVEHQYTNVVSSITRLYKRIQHLLSDAEVLAVQDLVDFEHIDGIEWTQDSDDEEDEVIEGMDVDE